MGQDKLRQMLQENGVDTNEGYTDVFMNGLVASTISGIMYAATGKDVQLDIGSRWVRLLTSCSGI